MSNIIPPLLSDSPPPPPLSSDDDEEDDEFGHFGRIDESFAYDCDNFSLPSSPVNLPGEEIGLEIKIDFNSNSKENVNIIQEHTLELHKDFHDKRKEVLEDAGENCKKIDSVDNNVDINQKGGVSEDLVADIEINFVPTTAKNVIDNVESEPKVIGDSLENSSIDSKNSEDDSTTNQDMKERAIDSYVNLPNSIPEKFEHENRAVVSDHSGDSCARNFSEEHPKIQTSDTEKIISNESKLDFEESSNKSSIFDKVTFESSKNDSNIADSATSNKFDTDFGDLTASNNIDEESGGACEETMQSIFVKDKVVNEYLDIPKSVSKIQELYSGEFEASKTNLTSEEPQFDAFCTFESNECDAPKEASQFSKDEIQNFGSFSDGFGEFSSDSENIKIIESYESKQSDVRDELNEDISSANTNDIHYNNEDDEFGDFSSTTKNLQPKILDQLHVDAFHDLNEKEDKFEELSSTRTYPESRNPKLQYVSIKDEEFGDFSSTTANPPTKPNKPDPDLQYRSKNEVEFGDFSSITTDPEPRMLDKGGVDDEFGDFEEFSDFKHESTLHFSSISGKDAVTKSEDIFKEIFPVQKEIEATDFREQTKYTTDPVFLKLKDITETNAMSYVWLKSSGQNLLLNALNIDVRNILFGPSWNPSMPRFAANLTLAPLEPIKSNAPVQSPVLTNPSDDSSQATNQNTEIPTAEFDWTGAGLTNPFDYSQTVLLDLENLVSQLDIPNFNLFPSYANSPFPVAELDEWDFWLQTQLSKTSNEDRKSETATTSAPAIFAESTNELSFDNPGSKCEDFTKYPSYENSPFHVPLRETHINNKHTFIDTEADSLGWLKPTILTPEVSRKNSQTIEINDDLYEFGMSSEPEVISSIKSMGSLQKEELKEVISLSDNSKVEFALMPHIAKPKIGYSDGNDKPDELDDFSDFQAAPLPPQHKETLSRPEVISINKEKNISQVAPVLTSPIEPLKPSVIYPQSGGSASISWPNPGGISDEDIKKFEGIYSKAPSESLTKATVLNEEKEVLTKGNISEDDWSDFASSDNSSKSVKTNDVTFTSINDLNSSKSAKTNDVTFTTIFEAHAKKSVNDTRPKQDLTSNHHKPAVKQTSKEKTISLNSPTPPKKPVKANSLEDDEWSEFVSVKTQSPAHKRVNTTESRSSTPDLPLSVLNLGNLQPAKQPIPVITPQGLIQTKLSSGNVLNIQSVMQNNYLQQHSVGKPIVQQPSLISNVFANQAYGGFNNTASSMPVTKLGNPEDDEWSDFVSHQAPSSNTSQHIPPVYLPQQKHNTGWFGQVNQSSNWFTAPQQNFASNSSGYGNLNPNMSNGVIRNDSVIQNRKHNSALNIPIPELDFVAPKGRTSNRK